MPSKIPLYGSVFCSHTHNTEILCTYINKTFWKVFNVQTTNICFDQEFLSDQCINSYLCFNQAKLHNFSWTKSYIIVRVGYYFCQELQPVSFFWFVFVSLVYNYDEHVWPSPTPYLQYLYPHLLPLSGQMSSSFLGFYCFFIPNSGHITPFYIASSLYITVLNIVNVWILGYHFVFLRLRHPDVIIWPNG